MEKVAFLNSHYDLGWCKGLPLNEVVEIVQQNKGGDFLIKDSKGETHSGIAKKNLEVHTICTCECHKVGLDVMHCMPCCGFTYQKYINEDGSLIGDKVTEVVKDIREAKRLRGF